MHQPDPNASPDMRKGIEAMRRLHIRVLEQTGLSGADEMLYPDNLRYVDDIVAYIAVGARSVENQQHRFVSSGADVPVGMKNPTSGDLQIMVNALYAAQRPQVFSYNGNEVQSGGNPMAHSILRGGKSGPNYDMESIGALIKLYEQMPSLSPGMPKIVVDASHDNSGKQHGKQLSIILDVLKTRKTIGNIIAGVMVESYLESGKGEKYGQSITDPCLGWKETRALIMETMNCLCR
jgi:3-deoxy-7-phosphoheptulonate synthase